MTVHYMFADEAGCFAFTRNNRASRYFILCSVTMTNSDIGQELLQLRRDLLMEGHGERHMLHASADPRPVRQRVYAILQRHQFRIDATIFEKAKAQPQTRVDEPTFYQYAWYYHLKYVLPRIVRRGDRILITGAALNTRKSKVAFKQAINNSAQQLLQPGQWEVTFLQSAEDPCLWVADYCAWAIQRKWELQQLDVHNLIRPAITSEYDLWARGTTFYY